jgi:hypothetical protein
LALHTPAASGETPSDAEFLASFEENVAGLLRGPQSPGI